MTKVVVSIVEFYCLAALEIKGPKWVTQTKITAPALLTSTGAARAFSGPDELS